MGWCERAGGSWVSSELCSSVILSPLALRAVGRMWSRTSRQHPGARKSCSKHSLGVAQIPPGVLQPLRIWPGASQEFPWWPGRQQQFPALLHGPHGAGLSTRRWCCKNGARTPKQPDLSCLQGAESSPGPQETPGPSRAAHPTPTGGKAGGSRAVGLRGDMKCQPWVSKSSAGFSSLRLLCSLWTTRRAANMAPLWWHRNLTPQKRETSNMSSLG